MFLKHVREILFETFDLLFVVLYCAHKVFVFVKMCPEHINVSFTYVPMNHRFALKMVHLMQEDTRLEIKQFKILFFSKIV